MTNHFRIENPSPGGSERRGPLPTLVRCLAAVLVLVLVLVLVAGAGCATVSDPTQDAEPEPESVQETSAATEPSPPHQGDRTGVEEPAQDEPGAPAGIEEPAGELTLRQALALVLAGHPELAVYSWDARIGEARALQAGLRPNPEIGFEVENVLGTGEHRGGREAETTLQLSQLIELGDKRAARFEAASRARDAAAWDYEVKRLEILTAAGEAFIEVLLRQEQLRLLEERARLARNVVETIDHRVREALAPAVDRTRAEVTLAEAEIERDQAERMLSAARRRLAALWNNPEPRFESARGDLTANAITDLPDLHVLRERLRRHPRLARWATEIAWRQANLRLEESRRWPDLTVGGGYRRLSGPDDHAFVAGVSIPLPFFDKNQGGIAEAEYRLAQAEDRRRAATWALSTALDQAWPRLEAAAAKVSGFKDRILPAAQRAADQLQGDYERGRFSYLDVLDAQRTLYSARARYFEALSDYHQALLAIERLVGNPLLDTLAPVTAPASPRP